jgi:Arc/MetJ-type ribon-helix-helix transcriptional regulator
MNKEKTRETKFACRVALRVTANEREHIESLIQRGIFKTISQAVRTALDDFQTNLTPATAKAKEVNTQ